MALIPSGDELLLAHRRLFEADGPRYYADVVDEYEDDITRETMRGGFVRKEDVRTKLVSLSAGTLIVYLLRARTRLDALRLQKRGEHRLVLTDGAALEMDMTDRVE